MVDKFLSAETPRSWTSDRTGADCDLYIGNGSSALEIIVTERDERPRKEWLHQLYSDRRSGRINPVLVVVLRDDGETVDVCGPVGEDPDVKRDLEPSQVERICETALDQPDHHAAQRFLDDILNKIDEELVGLHNQGLLSTHELKVGVPDRSDWSRAAADAQDLLDEEGRDLVEGLGYEIERLGDQSYVLKDATDARKSAVAVFLKNDESFDHAQDRFTGQTPISYALTEADKEDLDYVIASSDHTLRLYTTNPDAGFGSRGRTDTFVEVNTDLLTDENAGYLSLLFSSDALRDDGSLHGIMEDSKDYAADLGRRLRERIYDDVVPDLAEAIADARDLDEPTKEQLDETYRMSLVQLYRLLFVAYAEDEGFLPRHNPRYEKRSLKSKAHELHDLVHDDVDFDTKSTTHWDDVMELSRAIHDGHSEWGLPEYNGRLLSSDSEISEAGAKLTEIELSDDQFGPVLTNLLIDETEDGYEGPVDFRNIGVREFGVIYEGLLESELSVADQPLTVDAEGHYMPVDAGGRQTLREDDEGVVVETGQVYLHGQSGERKATGSYYTDSRFVSHLLEHSLEPALEEHTDRLDRLREEDGRKAAADAFFDIRVADISMGSGHFLVGAVDRIESHLLSYLSRDDVNLPQVERELDRLRATAEDAFETSEAMPEVERSQLLRRQIARRCIYGADINDLSTELARLSIWVHTFVPGLPLAFLDYNLTTGDSLSGIGTLGEVSDILDVDQTSLTMFMGGSSVMNEIQDAIEDIGQFADADAKQVSKARETRRQIEKQLEKTRAAFDVLAASRIEDEIDPSVVDDDEIDLLTSDDYSMAQDVLAETSPLHFPAAFPEVFNGGNGGFDVIVGNPPWEKAKIERHEFWARHFPGLRGLTQTKREARIEALEEERPDLAKEFRKERLEEEKRAEMLTNGPYPGIGAGDPDMYLAFAWRFWNLIQENGHVGVVLPRSAFGAAASEEFRRSLLDDATFDDLTFLVNNRNWVFPDVHPQYTVVLASFSKTEPTRETTLPLRGPYPDMDSFDEGAEGDPFRFPVEEAKNWTGTATFPLLPSNPKSVEAFGALSNAKNLDYDDEDEWRVVPSTEAHATQDKKKDDGTRLMHFTENPPDDYWAVYKGGSFNLWTSDTGDRYAWADPDEMAEHLQGKRENSYQYAGSRSPYSEFSEEWVNDKSTLPCYNARIAIRDVARATDTRTTIPALVPPNIFLTHTAPYFLWPRGDERDQAYLLGVLSSIPLDWYSRRFVENHLTYHILNALPIPRPGGDSKLRQRIVELSGSLAAVDDRYGDWADAVGVDYGPLDEDEKRDKIYELDAVVAHLYGLSRENLEIIFETFHENWNHEPRMTAVLEHYEEWEEKLE